MINRLIQNRERDLMWSLVYYAEELLQERSIESNRREIYSGQEIYCVIICFKYNMIKIERPQWTFNLLSLDLPIIGLKIKKRRLKRDIKEIIHGYVL